VAWLDSRGLERARKTVSVDRDFFQRESCEPFQESISNDIDAVL
jgi:hypothetical protein